LPYSVPGGAEVQTYDWINVQPVLKQSHLGEVSLLEFVPKMIAFSKTLEQNMSGGLVGVAITNIH
jgi:hypothetical protein